MARAGGPCEPVDWEYWCSGDRRGQWAGRCTHLVDGAGKGSSRVGCTGM